jgi:hypothetical protein
MGLLQNISKLLGYGGNKPQFDGETKISTLHNLSSSTGDPKIKRNPSILDETDTLNNNKFKSAKGQKYTDNLPR